KAVAAALGRSVGVTRDADGSGRATDRMSGATDRPDDAGLGVLAAIRERIASDLDAPGALAVVDAWTDGVLGTASPGAATSATSAESAALVRDAVDTLLGVRL